ncbi:MAG TPA: TIGR03557 family F420-dependent LLM class oxidoreductase [Acidimicrobiia bacterium]|nr:TIGR03557 family F420-dependent LLM class oxidoreductase [Acidimicrobiia bacterium]
MPKFAWLASHESYQPEVLIDQVVAADRAGFDCITASDHFHPWVDDQSAAGFVWTWLGAAAMRAERMTFITSVTCPLFHYHPALVAQAAATVSRLAKGGFVLGVGTGESINEGPLGYEFPGYGERIRRMKEALEIIQRLLRGEKLDYEGTYYQVRKAKLYSPPIGGVPVWMAAGGEQSAAFAGRNCVGLITSVKDPAETVANIIKPFLAERTGPSSVMATRWLVLASSDEEAWEALGSMRGLRAPGRSEAIDPMVLRKAADEMDPKEILSKYSIVSGPEQIIEAYKPLVTEIDADIVSIQVASTDAQRAIDMIGREVLPELRRFF